MARKQAIKVDDASKPSDSASPFQRFVKAMRALVAVPKSEVDRRLAEEKAKRQGGRASLLPNVR